MSSGPTVTDYLQAIADAPPKANSTMKPRDLALWLKGFCAGIATGTAPTPQQFSQLREQVKQTDTEQEDKPPALDNTKLQ